MKAIKMASGMDTSNPNTCAVVIISQLDEIDNYENLTSSVSHHGVEQIIADLIND